MPTQRESDIERAYTFDYERYPSDQIGRNLMIFKTRAENQFILFLYKNTVECITNDNKYVLRFVKKKKNVTYRYDNEINLM